MINCETVPMSSLALLCNHISLIGKMRGGLEDFFPSVDTSFTALQLAEILDCLALTLMTINHLERGLEVV